MTCETWIKLRNAARQSLENWLSNEESHPSDRAPTQIDTRQRLKEELFQAISAVQQHEKEHGCRSATDGK